MSTVNLSKIFNPKSIAIIGASEKKGSVGDTIMRNIVLNDFKGDIFPVNRNYNDIMSVPAFSNINDISKKIDMAIIATPIKTIPGILEACAEKKIGGAVIVSAGGKEIGKAGRQIEAKINNVAQKSGIRLIGPNCVGIINTEKGLNASFMHRLPLPGKTAFLSQSGAVCTSVLDLAIRENVGFSHFVSLGSMLDVDFADMIDYLGALEQVKSIAMYIENITHVRNFMSAARAVSRIKPIIALKSGTSKSGARAAASHTGAMAGVDTAYDAAFKRAGILRVDEFEELFDCVEFLAKQSRPKGGRLAIITNAGGPGVMATDALAIQGLEPAELSDETIKKLDTNLMKEWSRSNPVDVLGDSSPEQYIKAADICSNSPEVDGLLLICSPTGNFDTTILAKPLAEYLKTIQCPVFTSWIGGTNIDKSKAIFNTAGVVTFDTPERAVRAFAHLYQYELNIDMLHEIPVRKDKKLEINQKVAKNIIEKVLAANQNTLDEIEAKSLLDAYGIPVNKTKLAQTSLQAVQIAEEIGFPVVLKICSKDISHKSDSGGVLLNISSPEQVKMAFNKIIKTAKEKLPDADIEGISVQSMFPSPDYELIVGAKKDKDFGPVLLFGMGGVMTEIFKDTTTALPPLNYSLARKAIQETTISKVLSGYRNFKAVDFAIIEEIMIRVGKLVADFPEIEELDINPVLVQKGKIIGVDARVLIKRTSVVSPDHLIISPYPAWQEAEYKTTDNEVLQVRPIRPNDANQMLKFFSELSAETIYLRFFSPLKKLSKQMLIKFTQIDYDREIALIATMNFNGDQNMVGVARIIFLPDGETGEFAVVLSDKWQGKGIGAALLKRCLLFAKKQGLKKVICIVMSGNRQMLKLGEKLGFTVKKDSDPYSYDINMEIDLKK